MFIVIARIGSKLFKPRFLTPLVLGSLLLCAIPALAIDSPRERSLLDSDWRFTKDDPADAAGQLDYKKVKADVETTGQDLQNLPQSQEPLPEPVKGNSGENVSYVQNTFDDSGWIRLKLPLKRIGCPIKFINQLIPTW